MRARSTPTSEIPKDKSVLRIIDATSGNAGIAYAMIGAVLGYNVTLVMPENASEERKKRLIAHGAEIIYTDSMLGYDEALYEVKRRYEDSPDRYYYSDQYSNPNNPQAHYDTTAAEILRQAPDITHFVAGVGTGGTISGVGRSAQGAQPRHQGHQHRPARMARRRGPEAAQRGTHHPRHLRLLRGGRDAGNRRGRLIRDVAQAVLRRAVRGQSSGAYVQGAYEIAKRDRSGQVVTIFNDIGERYFSTGMWG